jgi:hypothetical protein
MSEQNRQRDFVLVIVTDDKVAYHSGIRITTHATMEELVADGIEFMESELGDPSLCNASEKKIYTDIKAAKRGNVGAFYDAMDKFVDLNERRQFRWSCWHHQHGGGDEMFEQLYTKKPSATQA